MKAFGKIAVLAMTLAMAFVLTACGGSASSSAASSAASGSSASASAASSAAASSAAASSEAASSAAASSAAAAEPSAEMVELCAGLDDLTAQLNTALDAYEADHDVAAFEKAMEGLQGSAQDFQAKAQAIDTSNMSEADQLYFLEHATPFFEVLERIQTISQAEASSSSAAAQ